jgi:hypothetical protein
MTKPDEPAAGLERLAEAESAFTNALSNAAHTVFARFPSKRQRALVKTRALAPRREAETLLAAIEQMRLRINAAFDTVEEMLKI